MNTFSLSNIHTNQVKQKPKPILPLSQFMKVPAERKNNNETDNFSNIAWPLNSWCVRITLVQQVIIRSLFYVHDT